MAEFHLAASVSGLLVWFMLPRCHAVLVTPEWIGASLMLIETPVKVSAVKRFQLPGGGFLRTTCSSASLQTTRQSHLTAGF